MGQPVILLSIADGIGGAKLALDTVIKQTNCHILSYLAWETEQDYIDLTLHKHGAQHRGDFTQDDVNDIAKQINQMDPGHQAIILICASISGGPDQEGTEVTMIEHLATWQRELQPLLGPRQIAKLTESVIPHRGGDIQHLAKKLGYGAIVFDAGEFQRISRPRVWWSTIDWDGPNIASVLGPNTTWKKYFGTYQVRCPQPIREAHIPAGWTAPDCWKVGETLPCLTPPAPTESGRAAPRSSKRCMDSATHGRWAANKRQYEPWHYYEHFLMAADQKTSSASRPLRPKYHSITSQWASPPGWQTNSAIEQSQAAGTWA
jgi:hypothetical protein